MNKTKIVASLLSVAMLAGIFAGCSKTTKITTDDFAKGCEKLGLDEFDLDDVDEPSLGDLEDGFYFIGDEDQTEQMVDEDGDYYEYLLYELGLSDCIDPDDIVSFGFAAKCIGIEDAEDVEDPEDLQLDGAFAFQMTLDDTDCARDFMDAVEDMLGKAGIRSKNFTGKEFYVSKDEGYCRFHIDVAKLVEVTLNDKHIDDLNYDIEDVIEDLTGDMAVSVEVKGENIFILAGGSLNKDATVINDFAKAFGLSNNPMKISPNEKIEEDMVDSVMVIGSRFSNSTSIPGIGSFNSGKIGISLPTKDLQRWNQDGDRMKSELEAAGYEVDLQYANNDVATQVSQIENMVNSGCQVLIIAAIEGYSLGTVLEQAKEKNVAVISYDRLIMETDAVDYYVTFDNYMVGTLQGKYVVGALDLDNSAGPFNIEFTAGDASDNNAYFFFCGAYDVLKPYIDAGKLVVVSGQDTFEQAATASWKTETAQARAENIISAYYDNGRVKIDAWVCSNDSTALGVTNALAATYSGPYPVITGQDCDLVCVKNIISGYQSMSVFKDTRTLASQAVKMASEILNGQMVEINDTSTYNNGKKDIPSFLCQPIFVDANNYREILIDSGFYTESDFI